MGVIRRLTPAVVNKIAAGEVIERPASVVKELVENSVDAGATRVDVMITQGGIDLVRVVDNGQGISPDDLPLAIASHATSKITTADDLFRVGTFGFRGEALASIAEVSHFLIRSRTASQADGAELETKGSEVSPLRPVGAPIGTTIEVRNLFFNTPVRRKFLRTTPTEVSHVSEAVSRIALAYPNVHFTLRGPDRAYFDLPPTESWSDRIAALCGEDLRSGLIWVESKDAEVALSGYVANPEHSRGNNRSQYLFLNGRCIRDRSLQHALTEAYRGLLMVGRHPVAFLRLEMPPELVDVNVHPTKLEVRFQDSGRIYGQLLGSIRKRFLTLDLTAKVQVPSENKAGGHDPNAAIEHQRKLSDWAAGRSSGVDRQIIPSTRNGSESRSLGNPFGLPSGLAPRTVDEETNLGFAKPMLSLHPMPGWNGAGSEAISVPPHSQTTKPRPEELGESSAPIQRWDTAHAKGIQIQNRYLITENEDGLVVVDQHALHERILYEQLKESVQSGKLEQQRLLVPEPLELPAFELAVALEKKDELSQFGIEIEPFGGNTILIVAYPAILANLRPSEVLRGLIDKLVEGAEGITPGDLLDEMLHMVACKAAIKAGDSLSADEVTALLSQRDLYENTHHCPHGRPTALVFTRDELDKRFKRT